MLGLNFLAQSKHSVIERPLFQDSSLSLSLFTIFVWKTNILCRIKNQNSNTIVSVGCFQRERKPLGYGVGKVICLVD